MKRSGLASVVAVVALFVPLCLAAQEVPPPPPEQEPAVQPPPERTPREQAELRGDVMMARKRYSEAIEIYQEILKQEPRNAALLNKVGIAFQHLNDFKMSRRYYERAHRADRTLVNAVNNLGTLYYQQKNYRRAEREYRRALKISPQVAVVHSNLGHALFARKKYEQALESFINALAIDPQLFERRGQTGTIVQNPVAGERATFFYVLAKSYAMMEDAERCAFYLRRALDEGYARLADVKNDPAFAAVLQNPLIQQILHPELVQPPVPPGN